MIKQTLLALGLIVPCFAYSAQLPLSAGYDERITIVPYNERDVVELAVKPGLVTQIVFGDGEEYEAHAVGDSEAWHIGHYKNFLFLKPAQPLGTTNLSVVTNKHNYMFKVNFVDVPGQDMYQVEFTYPNEEQNEQLKAQEKQVIKDRLDGSYTSKIYNLNYSMKGDYTIAPTHAYDDGTFTYFKFTGNVDLPAIYLVNQQSSEDHGSEHIVNKTIKGDGNDTVVMHKTGHQWRLRLGEQVLDIYNDNMLQGATNTSGTIAPNVERVVLGDD